MIKKRSRFWTVIFSCLPGAGHMYNGLMKLGVSFMGLFFAVWMIASFINVGTIAYLGVFIWFYAFFDCINRVFQDDEEFYAQEDHYLFTVDQLANMNFDLTKKRSFVIGITLIVVGIYALWNNVVIYLINQFDILPKAVYEVIVNISQIVPQILVAVLIIWAGVTLVNGKKKQIQEEKEAEEDEC